MTSQSVKLKEVRFFFFVGWDPRLGGLLGFRMPFVLSLSSDNRDFISKGGLEGGTLEMGRMGCGGSGFWGLFLLVLEMQVPILRGLIE